MTPPRYRIRPAAKTDLRNIGRYARRVWGREQAHKYLAALHDRMQALAANPQLGVVRDEVATGYRSARAGRHRIFYRIDADIIVVVRVLHESMDVGRHLATFDE